MDLTNTAVVLGPGGLVGTAWMTGLAAGMREHGADLADADLIVGSSAGAIVGAALRSGRNLEELAVLPTPRGPAPGPGRLDEVLAVLGDPTLDPAQARRLAGRIALETETIPEEAHLASMEFLTGAREWPRARLLITGVDVDSGEPVVWDRDSGAPAVAAVAASCAMPGFYPPISIGGRRYMDGGIAGGGNVGLAAGAERIVLVEPVAHLYAWKGDVHVDVRIVPDEESLEVFGPVLGDYTVWGAAYRAGVRQAAEAAGKL
ncbi:patatin-like phospholipase family protein [Spirillospora albida]|uniref:patatin-like phospholipase family protein n=1 Tax=Spirillospora albida TaxID=58123 RepID=UPI0004BE7754|nr:patatin-like phospholipase family protein [Spirillospora albida]